MSAKGGGPYVRVHLGLLSHEKLMSIPRRERKGCIGAWTLALLWSGTQQTDGRVPSYMLTELGVTAKEQQRLVDVRLWDEEPGGIRIHDYGDWQTTSAEIRTAREKVAERQRNHRARKNAGISGESADRHAPVTRYAGVSHAQIEGGTRRELEVEGGGRVSTERGVTREIQPPAAAVLSGAEPLKYCVQHPNDTELKCVACMRQRRRWEAWRERHPSAVQVPDAEWHAAMAAHEADVEADVRAAKARGLIGADWPRHQPLAPDVAAQLAQARQAMRRESEQHRELAGARA